VTAGGDFSIGSSVWPGLSKLVEEAGEVFQVCGKLMATGGEAEHWDGTNLVERLHDELGDLVGAIAFFVEVNSMDKPRIIGRGADKFSLFTGWQQSNRTEADHAE
jgi:NTP pyrophosphatase (non-canonical NTP hydrolase)